jgi:hypothetical protein
VKATRGILHIPVPTKVGVAVLVSLALLTAAGTVYVMSHPDSTPTAATRATQLTLPDDSTYLFGVLGVDSGVSSSAVDGATLEDLLPNHLVATYEEEPAPLCAGMAFGTIVDVLEGSGFDASGDAVSFSDPAVVTRSLILDVVVHQGLGGAAGAGHIRAAVVLEAKDDVSRAVHGFEELGEVLVVLDMPDAARFGSDVFVVAGSGEYIGTVQGEAITFPALGEGSSDFVDGIESKSSLLTAAARAAIVETKSPSQ